MEKINPGQLIALNTLVTKLNIGKQQKADMVAGFSNGRCESSKDLMKDEAAAMISHLKKLDPDEAKCDRMRKRIISMAHEMNWRIPGTTRADMKRIDDWCKLSGTFHKSLDNHTKKELTKLVTQFQIVHDKFMDKF